MYVEVSENVIKNYPEKIKKIKMKSFVSILNLMIISLVLGSCVKDDHSDCDMPGIITVSVRDKNYDNIGEIQGQIGLNEGLPFLSYLTSLSIWRHAAGDDTSESFETILRGGEMTYTVDPACLMRGANEVVVIGNETIHAQKYNSTTIMRELHPAGGEYIDIYIGSEDISYPVYEDYTIWMYRTKGKLLIQPVNIPSDIVEAKITVANIYGAVGKGPAYSGSATVSKIFGIQQTAADPVLDIMLAPSISPANTSPVTIMFTKHDGSTVTLSNIYTKIHRNRISIIRPIYDIDTDEWTLEVLVDGKWVQVDNLNIN